MLAAAYGVYRIRCRKSIEMELIRIMTEKNLHDAKYLISAFKISWILAISSFLFDICIFSVSKTESGGSVYCWFPDLDKISQNISENLWPRVKIINISFSFLF